MKGTLWPNPGTTTCKRVGCEAEVRLKAGNSEANCSEACRLLQNVAAALVNCKQVPRGRNHERDVTFVSRVLPVGNVVPVVLSREDFGILISLRNAYLWLPPSER